MYHAMSPSTLTPQVVAERLYANAYAALSEGRGHDASKSFSLMAAVVPKDERCWIGLGASLEQIGSTERALHAYTTGCRLVPGSVFCKLGQARTLAKLGQLARALQLLDRAELDANEVTEVQLIDRVRGEL